MPGVGWGGWVAVLVLSDREQRVSNAESRTGGTDLNWARAGGQGKNVLVIWTAGVDVDGRARGKRADRERLEVDD